MRCRAEHRTAASVAPVALLLSAAVILGYVESVVLPPLPVPGVRLGLANVAVVITLAAFGVRAAAMVSFGRVFLVALALGTLGSPSFVLALGGAGAALAVMAFLSRAGRTFSVIGWSVAGSAAHVTAQLALAALVVGHSSPLVLMPLALGLSVPLGLAVGHVARLLLSHVPDWSLSAAGR